MLPIYQRKYPNVCISIIAPIQTFVNTLLTAIDYNGIIVQTFVLILSCWGKNMPVSIKDIARVANVSFSTVSRALADSPRVKPETRERIQRLAIEMGYAPSAAARSLVTHRTKTIGVVATTMTDMFQAEVVQAIEETAIGRDHSVILTQSGFASEREMTEIQALRERRVDGIILISVRAGGVYAAVLQGTGIPLVFINARQTDYGHSVRVDSLAGSLAAVQHLLDLGHKQIAYITGPDEDWDNIARQAGYQQSLEAYGLPVDPALIVKGDSRPEGGIRAMQQLLSLRRPPTAVFCYNDATALGAMRAAYSAGLRVPEDVSIVGFDDIDLAPFFEPPLTTVAQPIKQLGEKAVETILADMDGEGGVVDCLLPGNLVVRSSTTHPNQS